jgi:Holliday junction resolvasome RuvABC endonuclease subunit
MRYKIAAFDPSLTTGWCTMDPIIGKGGKPRRYVRSGVWRIDHKATKESIGMRWIKLENHLVTLFDNFQPQIVVVEVPAFAKNREIAVMKSCVAIIQKVSEQYGLQYFEANPKTIKKHATGNGNASKEMMINAAIDKWGNLGWKPETNDEADARWIADWAYKQYRRS